MIKMNSYKDLNRQKIQPSVFLMRYNRPNIIITKVSKI